MNGGKVFRKTGNGKGAFVYAWGIDWGAGKGEEQDRGKRKRGYRHDCEDEICFVAD